MILASPQKQTAGAVKGRLATSLLIGTAGLCLLASLFLPIWRITLDAPQYPEGMGMRIWARTITGENPHDLDIINQLNHYIGMKKIVPESIPELRIIAPIIGAFGVLCLLAAFRPRAWSIALLLAGLSAAGALGMYDFWRWEYDYGHNLDPKAAIRIPGMSYQPPLIGTAKLLNFTSTSWPAAGGYLLFAAGGLLAAALLIAWRPWEYLRPAAPGAGGSRPGRAALSSLAFLAAASLAATGCVGSGPSPIDWGIDACHHCKMALVQKGFAAQRINAKGKAFKFDAIECLLADLKDRPSAAGETFYVSDLSRPDSPLLPAAEAVYLKGGSIRSPMGGALAGFALPDSAQVFQNQVGGTVKSWSEFTAR